MPISDKSILDLSSKVEMQMNYFHNWTIQRIKSLNDYITKQQKDDNENYYYNELYQDCLTWYLHEGKNMYSKFRRSLSLTPFFIHQKQVDDLNHSLLRLQNRWDDLFQHIDLLGEVEDLYQWLLDLPYLLEKRLNAFGIISYQREIQATVTKTSPQETCLFLRILKGCVS